MALLPLALSVVAGGLWLARGRGDRAVPDVGPGDGAAAAPFDGAVQRVVHQVADAGSAPVAADDAGLPATGWSPVPCTQADCGVAPPWFIEGLRSDLAQGECGMEEAKWHVRIRHRAPASDAVASFDTFDETCPEGSGFTLRATTLFDYDHDGSPELILETALTRSIGVISESGSIWTYRDGRVTRYEPGDAGVPRFEQVEDLDGDGRPDLLSRGGFEGPIHPGGTSYGSYFAVAPLFAAHALPTGAFTTDDATAKKLLAVHCPRESSLGALLQTVPGLDWDRRAFDHALALAIACGRARGRSEAEVTATLRTHCKVFEEDVATSADADAGPGTGKLVCPSWALTLAHVTPPLRSAP